MVDFVLLMSVNPGFSGQSFQMETFDRVKKLRGLLDKINPQAAIQIDGGVSADNIKQLNEAGASIFVAATAIFKHPKGPKEGIRFLREALL
jgi:ribulose-phosphate 3-epimerase